MNNTEDLTGMLVLVHPELADDPLRKQGQAGMLLYADTEKDDVYVTFGKGEQALYSSDALLVFKQPNDIYQALLTNTRDIPIPELKALYRIGMLLDQGTSASAKEATQLAVDNPSVHGRAMMTLQEKLGIETGIAADQHHELVMGRGR